MDIQTIWHWIQANPLVVAILVITEIMPFLPVKANGICQAALNILTKLKGGING